MHPRKLETRILQAMNLANRDFELMGKGDRILVAMSGGKDSYAMMWGLLKLQAAMRPYMKRFAYASCTLFGRDKVGVLFRAADDYPAEPALERPLC